MFIIGLGEYAITDVPEEKIITHALGSCVALIVYCKHTKCTAMAHIVLPKYDDHHSYLNHKEAYFADNIVPRILDFYIKQPGCHHSQLDITIIGGADSKNKNDHFKVGPRNLETIEKILKDYGLTYDKKETSGHYSRSVEIDVNTGKIEIRKNKMLL